MKEDLNQNPQLIVSGVIDYLQNFDDCQAMYIKYKVFYGELWKLQYGSIEGESFESLQNKSDNKKVIIQQLINFNLITRQIRGWPKFVVEIWQIDENDRHNIAGYTQFNVPFEPGIYTITSQCWRPQTSFFEKLRGNYPELVYKDVIISSESRNGFYAESTGEIVVQLQVLAKDFQFHGIRFN